MWASLRNFRVIAVALAAVPAAAPARATAQPANSQIRTGINNLRSVSDSRRPQATTELAQQIRTLPPGREKLALADALSHLVTEGDPGHETLQMVAETLAQSLKESPVTPKEAAPPAEYMDLARLIRYEGVSVDLKDPLLAMALGVYEENDADAAGADFTLKDLHGRPVTLSQLRGKIVLVSFWATWCPPCRKEMADLDQLYAANKDQGLVILSISNEDADRVSTYVKSIRYRPQVLIDQGSKVAKRLHVDGLPRTFVFDREGKLAAQATDMRTRQQFLRMLTAAGLKPA